MVSCPICKQPFGSQIELSLHTSHNHRGASVPIVTAEPVVVAEEEHESGPEYALATSKEGLGELCPVLKDKFGNIIDGFHRKGENANWREETLDWIDTPEKLEAARLAVNYARRRMAPEEISERITHLVKSGLKVEEIAQLTGIRKTTIYKYMPQELKDQRKSDAGKVSGESRSNSVPLAEHNVEIQGEQSPVVPRVRTFAEATAEVASTPLTPCTEPEPEESLPEGCPICPICNASMDLAEYKEIKQKAAAKFGKSIQTLLFPEVA